MNIYNNIYNHLGKDLAPVKRNTTHKAKDLKNIYTAMSKHNKNSPLYMLSMSGQKQSRIIDIKEAALTMKDISDSFADSENEIYQKKLVTSSNASAVSASLRGNSTEGIPDELQVTVHKLATEQINTGNYLPDADLDFSNGRHSFHINTVGKKTKLTFDVNDSSTNRSILSDIAGKINNHRIGIKASLLENNGETAIMLSSNEPGERKAFSVSLDAEDEILGISTITKQAANCSFTINDETHESPTNNISINQTLELDFHKEDVEPVTISFTSDITIANNKMDSFIGAFNQLVDMSNSESYTLGTRSLKNDISAIAGKHTKELRDAGIEFDEDGHMVKATEPTGSREVNYNELFSNINSFKKDVTNAVNRISIDPVAYINKLIVTYPNKNDKFSSSYTQSIYSGLMYNNYA